MLRFFMYLKKHIFLAERTFGGLGIASEVFNIKLFKIWFFHVLKNTQILGRLLIVSEVLVINQKAWQLNSRSESSKFANTQKNIIIFTLYYIYAVYPKIQVR